ncbi:hypothetical protein SOVF_195680, partial [Spinacia oleracea]
MRNCLERMYLNITAHERIWNSKNTTSMLKVVICIPYSRLGCQLHFPESSFVRIVVYGMP